MRVGHKLVLGAGAAVLGGVAVVHRILAPPLRLLTTTSQAKPGDKKKDKDNKGPGLKGPKREEVATVVIGASGSDEPVTGPRKLGMESINAAASASTIENSGFHQHAKFLGPAQSWAHVNHPSHQPVHLLGPAPGPVAMRS